MGYCVIVYKLPEDAFCGSYLGLKKKVYGYLKVMHFGYSYYIPVVKEFRKVIDFKITKFHRAAGLAAR